MQATIRIPGYDSFQQIAVGGMAVVFKARKQSLKKTVAVKVLLPHLAADARFVMRFQQEAEAAASVQHDNIVNVIDYGHEDDAYYIVMEFYDGPTVEELLRARPRIPVDIALSIALHVAYGLDAAHAQSLVHRDIKPANIILTRQGAIKIADFGLAKDVEKITLVTHDGKVVGTPAYMSPEQTRGEPVDKPSDIFSLGVVLYEMLAGKRPFEGSSFSEVIDRIQSFQPPSPSSLNPEVDASVESIVNAMMAKSPLQRMPSMQMVCSAIDAVMRDHEFQIDRRGLKDFCADPQGYKGARSSKSGTERVRNFLGRMGLGTVPAIEEDAGVDRVPPPAKVELDPTLDYRITLLKIDRELETPDSFALKLAMRLKAPVPRMRSLAARAPCVLVERLPYKKARWLVNVVKELGGEARMDAIVPPSAVASARPEAPPPPVPPVPAQPEPESPSGKVQSPRSVPKGAIVCPSCGWEEDMGAKFCTMCRHSFNKTDKIDLNAMRQPGFADPAQNPLSTDESPELVHQSRRRWHAEVPGGLVIGIGAALLLLPIILFLVNLGR
ncbi:MAG: serine/threonine protein kinase [Candidatus Krumholzibacteria bacterium]|nr:serine/threonine protein kinase [Candidatus Krumholzibacteria bacterium]MDH4336369.1 serine/threonine protein kinase [Candidatus Krumholzibacteria bacterium]